MARRRSHSAKRASVSSFAIGSHISCTVAVVDARFVQEDERRRVSQRGRAERVVQLHRGGGDKVIPDPDARPPQLRQNLPDDAIGIGPYAPTPVKGNVEPGDSNLLQDPRLPRVSRGQP